MRRLIAATAVILAALAVAVIPANASPAPSTSQAGCFGHNGVVISGHIAHECLVQPADLGGALYWSANESNFNWDKHPASGLLWTEASTLYPTPDANPANPYQDFWVGIAHAGGTFCTVINPGYDQKPTLCEFAVLLTASNKASCSAIIDPGSGQPKVCETVKIMDTRRQDSYNQLAAAITAAKVPDCAWSMTVSSSACDIDS